MSDRKCKGNGNRFLSRIVSKDVLGSMFGILAVLAVVFPASALGSHVRTQVFELEAGWNAIYLEVDPLTPDPAVLFTNTPVDIISSFDGQTFTQQFVSDRSTDMLELVGWATWYSPSRPDAFLSRLGAIYGRQAYLVHLTEAHMLEIPGKVTHSTVQWRADEFNLVGFSVDRLAAPSFGEFFAPSKSHQSGDIYVLRNGLWKKVTDPSNQAMKSGEAFWIHCQGASSYQGPLQVTSGSGGVLAINQNQVNELVLKNCSGFPLTPSVAHVVPANASVPLSMVVEVVKEDQVQSGLVDLGSASWETEITVLEANESIRVPLALPAEKLSQATVKTLLCIKSDLGTETWIPVVGTREDLK